MVDIDALPITKGVSQYGHVLEVTFGGNVVAAAQFVHFTVLISCLSSLFAFSDKNVSKSFSTISVCCSDSISFFAPQYSQFKYGVPGKYFKFAPQSLHFIKLPISAV